MLLKLPSELLDLIAKKVTTKRDLSSLCLVSRATKALFTPVLYNEIIVEFSPESATSIGKVSSHWTDSESAIANLGHVRHIHFVADIHTRLVSRCDYFDIHSELGGHPKDLGTGETSIEDLDPEAILILECIAPACLISFSWELGTCVPSAVSEYIRNSQPNLQNISLVTGWDCVFWREPTGLFSRTISHKRIKRLSWISPASPEQLLALASVVRVNAQHLEEFQVDLIRWSAARHQLRAANARTNLNTTCRNFFAEVLLALGNRNRDVLFPKLRTLSLTQVSFRHATIELVWALNLRELRRLVLRDCYGAGRVFQVLANDRNLKLRELEVIFNLGRDPSLIEPGLVNLSKNLAVMQKLEKLYLMTRQVDDDPVIFWESMKIDASHSLRQLVVHYRDEEIGYLDPAIYDSLDEVIPDDTLNAMSEYLAKANVEWFGFHSNPKGLLRVFSSRPSTIKFFHWRLSGLRKRFTDIDDEDSSSDDISSIRSDADLNGSNGSSSDSGADNGSESSPTHLASNHTNENSVPMGPNMNFPGEDQSTGPADDAPVVGLNDPNTYNRFERTVEQDVTLARALAAGLRSEMEESEVEQYVQPPDYVLSNNHIITLDKESDFSPRYLRRSRGFLPIDFANFLAWAFSDDGLPSLQIVVMGDMCHGGRYEASLRIFLRPQKHLHHLCVIKGDQPVFQELRDHEPRFQEIIREYREILEACPVEPIFREDGKPPIARPGFRHFPCR